MAKKSDPESEPVVAEVDGQKETPAAPARKDPAAPDEVISESPAAKSSKAGGNRFKRLLDAYLSQKKLSIPLTVLVLIGLLAAIPPTRYAIAGTVVKNDVTITVLDESTGKPVSKASVSLGDAVGETDAKGVVKLHVSVGTKQAHVAKKYYADGNKNVLVGIFNKKSYEITVKATGRQVAIRVINKINTVGIDGAVVTAAGSEVKTGNDGKAIIVLPPDNPKASATIKAKGFNDSTVTIPVTDNATGVVTFELVPAGKIYFLSKLSGKIDVVKTNLDGSERQTVLAGTGKEDSANTVLLASTDWKYLALQSRRDGGEYPKLFLIDTSSDKVTTMDEGKATFDVAGWSKHHFVYQVDRVGYQYWQPKASALKAYNADTGKIVLLDETTADGSSNYDYAQGLFGGIYVLGDDVVYSKYWSASADWKLNGRAVSLIGIKPDGSGKKTIKDFAVPAGRSYYSIETRPYEAKGLYIRSGTEDYSVYHYFEYENGKITEKKDLEQKAFYESYPTYLESPSGERTFWAEDRDGKNVLFVGNDEGDDGKQVASLSDYQVYGWYTDKYLLISQKASELYIMQVAGGTPIKVTDYHKPVTSFYGYGKGYGGL